VIVGAGAGAADQQGSELWTTDDDDPRLLEWNRRILPWIAAAAILPFIGFAGSGVDPLSPVMIAVDTASWLVFLVDLLVRRRLVPGYLRSKWGWVDLLIVVGTFPWYLFVGSFGRVVVVFRLVRLGRLVVLAARMPTTRKLVRRLNKVALASVVVMVSCAWVAMRSDGPADNFDNFGDALWWGIVTMTTTGYGDIVPDTTPGRIAGAVLMLSGLILLGSLAASVASFLTAGDAANAELLGPDGGGHSTDAPLVADTAADAGTGVGAGGDQSTGAHDPVSAATSEQLLDEISALRSELAELRKLLGHSTGP
jgi:voltage-gated potassium channel